MLTPLIAFSPTFIIPSWRKSFSSLISLVPSSHFLCTWLLLMLSKVKRSLIKTVIPKFKKQINWWEILHCKHEGVYHFLKLLSLLQKSCLHYSIIKMNVNTQKDMFTLSQGVHSVCIWTLLCAEKCLVIWSPVRIISVKCLLEPSVLFPLPSVKGKNKAPLARKICWSGRIWHTTSWGFLLSMWKSSAFYTTSHIQISLLKNG